MKRKVLALIIPALLMASTAHAAEIYNKDGNKLDLYGKVDGLHYFSDDKGADGDQTYIRLGFKGETQINDLMTGYGQWEYNVQANNTEGSENQSWTRLAFAGLKFGQYGTFDYGRNYGVLYDVEAWTDMLPEFGGDSYSKADNFMTNRANGVATYRNADLFGLVEGLNVARVTTKMRATGTKAPITVATFVMKMGTASVSPLPTISGWVSAPARPTPPLTVPTRRLTVLRRAVTKQMPGPPA